MQWHNWKWLIFSSMQWDQVWTTFSKHKENRLTWFSAKSMMLLTSQPVLYSSGRGCFGCWFYTARWAAGPSWGGQGQRFVPGCSLSSLPWGAVSQLSSPVPGPAAERPRMPGWMPWDQEGAAAPSAPCVRGLLGSWTAASYFNLLEFWRKGLTDKINLEVLIRRYLALPLPLIQNDTCSFNTLDYT